MSRIAIATLLFITTLCFSHQALAGDCPTPMLAATSTVAPSLQAVEFESLFPMFFSGGYHFCFAYRYDRFRVRLSVINGGSYDAEPAGQPNAKGAFQRYYKTSPGLFLGYNVWHGLEVYTFFEGHTFNIEQRSTGATQNLRSLDFGGGVSYQFFIGRVLYIQLGAHVYLRERKTLQFADQTYRIPGIDVAPVIRIGVRLWETGEQK
jgi:hypothetical protein